MAYIFYCRKRVKTQSFSSLCFSIFTMGREFTRNRSQNVIFLLNSEKYRRNLRTDDLINRPARHFLPRVMKEKEKKLYYTLIISNQRQLFLHCYCWTYQTKSVIKNHGLLICYHHYGKRVLKKQCYVSKISKVKQMWRI